MTASNEAEQNQVGTADPAAASSVGIPLLPQDETPSGSTESTPQLSPTLVLLPPQ